MSDNPCSYPWLRADDEFGGELEFDCAICGEPAAWVQWECIRNIGASPMVGICAQHAAMESRDMAQDLYTLLDHHDDSPLATLGMFLALLYVGDLEWPPKEVDQSAAVQYVADRKAASNVGG